MKLKVYSFKNNFIYALLILFQTGCALDNMFLFPYKLQTEKNYTVFLRDSDIDTLDIIFSNDSHEISIKTLNTDFILTYNVENIFFSNKENKKLNGLFFKPLINESDITILFLHGNAGHVLSHYGIVHHLAKRGYQVFLFDYSGFGFSKGIATRRHVLNDACAAFDYVYNRNDVKGHKIVIYGQSLGGNLAPVVACKREEYTDALVVEGAFSSHDDIAAYSTNLGILARLAVNEQYCAKKAVEKWQKPILIIHSREDSIVPYFMGERLFEYANKPKYFFSIDKPHITGPIYYGDSISYRIRELVLSLE